MSQLDRGPNFDARIDIWRTEVSSSPIFCVCSEPPAPPAAESSEETDTGRGGSTSQLVPGTAPASAPKSDNTAAGGLGLPRSLKQRLSTRHRPRLLFKAKSAADAPHTHRVCAVCLLPVEEDVLFVSFRGDGSAKVRLSEVARMSEVPLYKGPMKERLVNTLSGIFKGSNRLPSSDDGPAVAAAAPETETGTGIGAATGTGKGAAIESKQAGEGEGEPRGGTAMYHALRGGEGDGGVDDDEASVATLGALSDGDDERRKPQLTIDETAARLRRAQKLLRSKPHTG
ncbi:hypothetical protein F4779DRAFT_397200 [Xylariaceae sp. FL0662B]|nr:hypothetical protein F4779DRAFT_397200 [Xylariaceae sp. FL0662B]